METISISQVNADIAKLIEKINETQQPILITGEKENAVLISETEWNAIQETLYLQSIPGMTESILDTAATPLEECVDFKNIDC